MAPDHHEPRRQATEGLRALPERKGRSMPKQVMCMLDLTCASESGTTTFDQEADAETDDKERR